MTITEVSRSLFTPRKEPNLWSSLSLRASSRSAGSSRTCSRKRSAPLCPGCSPRICSRPASARSRPSRGGCCPRPAPRARSRDACAGRASARRVSAAAQRPAFRGPTSGDETPGTRDLVRAAMGGRVTDELRRAGGAEEVWFLPIDGVASKRGGDTKIGNAFRCVKPRRTKGRSSKAHQFVMGLLVAASGARTPLPRRTYYTKRYVGRENRKGRRLVYKTQLDLACLIIKELKLPENIKLVVLAGRVSARPTSAPDGSGRRILRGQEAHEPLPQEGPCLDRSGRFAPVVQAEEVAARQRKGARQEAIPDPHPAPRRGGNRLPRYGRNHLAEPDVPAPKAHAERRTRKGPKGLPLQLRETGRRENRRGRRARKRPTNVACLCGSRQGP